MHTILGAGGPIANALTKELLANGKTVRLVSRKPATGFEGASWVRADLKNFNELLEAAKGSTVLYMCAGLQYSKKVWAVEWPLIMQNLINAAEQTGARLIFFDNVYMYGHVTGIMTEETPYNPSSVKGEIRARIAEQLMSEIKAGNIKGSIARAADFYGASANSFFDSLVLAKYVKGQSAMWLGNSSSKHCFTYVPDAGKAMAILGEKEASDGSIWHLPTARAMKGIEFIKLAATVFEAAPKYITVNKLMLRTLGLFTKSIGETAEMYYQYQYDYIFDSSKFERAFAIQPTTYDDGLKQLHQSSLYKKS